MMTAFLIHSRLVVYQCVSRSTTRSYRVGWRRSNGSIVTRSVVEAHGVAADRQGEVEALEQLLVADRPADVGAQRQPDADVRRRPRAKGSGASRRHVADGDASTGRTGTASLAEDVAPAGQLCPSRISSKRTSIPVSPSTGTNARFSQISDSYTPHDTYTRSATARRVGDEPADERLHRLRQRLRRAAGSRCRRRRTSRTAASRRPKVPGAA